MSGAQRAALDALNTARPVVARLDVGKNSEDLAADIIESWNVVETGLRSLVGGSALTGQTLIRELRQRQLLSLEQANALAEFHAARERAARTDYQPTAADVAAVRDAFLKLEAGMLGDTTSSSATSSFAPGGARPTVPPAPSRPTVPVNTSVLTPAGASVPVTPVRRARPSWLVPVLAVIVLLVLGGIAWYAFAGTSSNKSLQEGVTAYKEGRREAAAGAFIKATKDDPADPMPHIYLSRMAREAGNMATAQQEAVQAVKLGPTNALALRELASVSFAMQDFDSARKFYIRALQVDDTDHLSQGYLGCSLVRLGRLDEGVRWIQRAGAGPWTACAPAPGSVPVGTMPPGMTPNGRMPVGAQPMAPR